jgi:hypothetical protein
LSSSEMDVMYFGFIVLPHFWGYSLPVRRQELSGAKTC